jgi:5-methyltetrahydrofolate--homocysteine methyltransferase
MDMGINAGMTGVRRPEPTPKSVIEDAVESKKPDAASYLVEVAETAKSGAKDDSKERVAGIVCAFT